MCVCTVAQSCPTLRNPMGCSCQASLSMAFSRQEYWSGLPFPISGDLQNSGIKPTSPASTGRFFTTAPPVTRLEVAHLLPVHYCLYVHMLMFKLFIFIIYFQINAILSSVTLSVYCAGSPLLLGPPLPLRTGAHL